MLYLKFACSGLWLEERGIIHLKRACFALWLIERGVLHFEACQMGLTRNRGEMTVYHQKHTN